MIKSVRPSKLKGLTLVKLQERLEKFFECPVDVEEDKWIIHCVELYDSSELMWKHAKRLANLGQLSCLCVHDEVVLQLVLNPLTCSHLQVVTTVKE